MLNNLMLGILKFNAYKKFKQNHIGSNFPITMYIYTPTPTQQSEPNPEPTNNKKAKIRFLGESSLLFVC